MLKKILKIIHIPVWLMIFLCFIFILRIPSFFEPYFYGDEMIYLALGQGIRIGTPLYQGIFDNKPPLLYITAAIAGNLFWFRALLAFFNLISICLFWKLVKILFTKKKTLVKMATILFGLLTTLPLLEGNVANAELFMIVFTLSGLLIIFSKPAKFIYLFSAGVLFSLAALYKIPAAFNLLAPISYWFIQALQKKGRFGNFIKKTVILSFGFILPILLTFIWFYFQGSFQDYLIAAFLQNVGYLSSFRPEDVQKSFFVRNLPLITRGLIVFLGFLLITLKRKVLSKQFIFISLWLLFGLFAVTLSERPYPHYLIQVVPSISILFAILFTENSLEQSLAILPLTLAFFIPVFYNYYRYPTLSYYTRFIKLVTGISSERDYVESFDKNIVRNYDISNFLASSSSKKDKIYVIGNGSTIYALSRRLPPGKYVAGYHINDYSSYEEEAKILEEQKPKFIVILPGKTNFSPIIPVIRNYYILVTEIDGAEIWKLSFNKN